MCRSAGIVFLLAFGFLLSPLQVIHCQVRLPRLISDGMILQRVAEVKIWGWSGKNENIAVQFIDSTYHTQADSLGNWSVVLSTLKAGGPYEMQIIASNIITVHDILVGDVWICSGQSNMELPMKRVSPLYPTEIANSENTFIRQFTVPQKYNFNIPQTDLQGGSWVSANPSTVLSFSAVAYFFACELYNKYKIPVGLINASLGGSPAEAWISENSLKQFPEYYEEAQRFKDSSLIKRIEDSDNQRIQAWYKLLHQKDEGFRDPQKKWSDPFYNSSDWPSMKVPGYWADTPLGPVNGVVWFRTNVLVPAGLAGKQAKLLLGRIVDADSVFINGKFIGSTGYQYPPRRYEIPAGILKEGGNSMVVRVISTAGKGGFVPDKPYEIIYENEKIDLKGNWQFQLGAKMEPLASQTFIRWKPVGLYNGMISPLLNYKIKGVIWYQGESNANKPSQYAALFQTLIKDWRNSWKQGDFPFLFVQLPNFMESSDRPGESNWALLRESQGKALSLPKTAMAVAIDIGEWNDIHPLNKKDVGKRLAVAAQNVAYRDTSVTASGPVYKAMKIEGHKIELSFSNVGKGLMARGGGELTNFSVSGPDKQFYWAKAIIKKDKVIVSSDKVPNPVAVRYAWADNPKGANFYNKNGLPASPFRTDKVNE